VCDACERDHFLRPLPAAWSHRGHQPLLDHWSIDPLKKKEEEPEQHEERRKKERREREREREIE